MLGKRAYCILGTMLLAFATLGTGVSAEQSNEQVTDLEDLGILELSYDDGVVEALVEYDVLLSLMDSDDDALPAIEHVNISVSLSDEGKIIIDDVTIEIAHQQADEISMRVVLSDDLVQFLCSEDVEIEELLNEIGFGDDLGLDDFTPEIEDDYWGTDVYWADQAYQVRGSQDDYDAVMNSEDAEEEFYRILVEFEENYDSFAEDTFGARLHWADEAYQIRGSQDDYDRVMSAEDPADEFYRIYEDFMQESEDDEVEEESDDEQEENEWENYPEMPREQCARGLLRGMFTVNDDGNGTMRGLVMNQDGDVIGNIWGQFNTDGFAHGFGGADNLTDAKWKAVYEDGRFTGLWKMIDENDSMNGLLKGHYELNETGDGGVFHGKWKELDCRDMREESEVPDMDDIQPRHTPLRVDSDRVDVRPLDKNPQQKPLMDKIGEVMDKPIVEDDEGGLVINVGDAAAGSTLGTIVLLGAGFVRRRLTGGI